MRKFFLIDSISSYKAMPNLVDDTFRKEDELSMLRYMKSIEVMWVFLQIFILFSLIFSIINLSRSFYSRIKVQNDREGGHIYSPLIVTEYGELKKQDIQDNKQIKVDYKVIFILTNNSVNNSVEVSLSPLSYR